MSANILLLDCQKMFVEGLKSNLYNEEVQISKTCCTFKEAIKELEMGSYDLIIFELNIADLDGIGILEELKRRKLSVRKLILSSYSEPKFVRSAMLKGADGFVSKESTTEELIQAIEEVLDGGIYIGEGLSTTPVAYDKHAGSKSTKSICDSYTLRKSLTSRESEILELLIEKKSNKQIGKELYISHQTVGVHKKNIIKKLGLKSSEKLINFALENRLVNV